MGRCLADEYDGFIVDLDGVVHVGWEPLPGAVETLIELHRRGKGVVFLTNEPRFARTEIAERLRGLGLGVLADSVVTAGWVAAQKVAEGGARVYVIGSADLRAEVAEAGATVVCEADAGSAERVLVTGHTGFDYQELRAACRAGANGAQLYTTSCDATFPMPDGPWPGTGAVLAAVEAVMGTTGTNVGKPEAEIFRVAHRLLGEHRQPVAVIGDHPNADIAGGHRAGFDAVLVGDADGLPEGPSRPDYAISGLVDLLATR